MIGRGSLRMDTGFALMNYVWIDAPQIHGLFGFKFTLQKLRVPLCLLSALVVQKSP